jgi:RNA polymerase sigma-70 factor (ECF subfamily)
MVVSAGGETSLEHRDSLARLCQSYWRPVHAYVASQGYSPEDAQDLTQEFFARFIEKNYSSQADQERGRFRSFLLAAVKHFLGMENRRNQAQKRGGGITPTTLDFEPQASATPTPAQIYERRWAMTVIEHAMTGLKNMKHFEHLKGCLTAPDDKVSYAVIAGQLGITESAVKVSVHRMRRRFGHLLRAEIAQTVESENQVEDELRYLLTVISA